MVAMVMGLALFGGCASTELQQPEQDNIGLAGGSQSECKAFGGSADESVEARVAGEVTIETHHTWALLSHTDVVYNCAADISFELQVDGTTLIITEVDNNTTAARCVCPLDLEVKIMNLVEGTTYRVMLYNEDHSILFADKSFRMEECNDQCVTAEDCEGLDLAHPECEGQWTCLDGQCGWECNSQVECQEDADCPYGYACVWYEYHPVPENGETDADDMAYPGTDPAYGGVCEQIRVECTTDADCYAYDYENGGTDMAEPACNGDWACVEGLCEFSCQEITCQDSADCPQGQECVFYDFLDYGFCEYVQRPEECLSDADCPEDFHCEYWDAYPAPGCEDGSDPNCIPPEPYYGMCVPNDRPRTDCWSDEDCRPGERCEFYWNDENCMDEDGQAMPCDPIGQCVPERPIIECFEDAQCPDGMVCVMDDYTFPEGVEDEYCGIDEDGAVTCLPVGVCMPGHHNGECETNEDCPMGHVCEIMAVDCDPAAGTDCYPYEMGVCVPDSNPEYCFDDSECAEGFHCEMEWDDTYPGEGEYPTNCMDEETGMVLPCMPPPGMCVPNEEPPNPGECRSDYDCPMDQFCMDGLCTPREEPPYPGECEVDSDCMEGFICEMMAVDCVDEEGTDCYPYEIGVCVPVEEPRDCVVDSDCPMGFFCAADRGECLPREEPPVECNSDAACGPREVCVDGQCVPGELTCEMNSDCAPHQVCMDGVCVEETHPEPLECRMDADCPADLVCVFVDWCGVGACVAEGQEVPETYCR